MHEERKQKMEWDSFRKKLDRNLCPIRMTEETGDIESSIYLEDNIRKTIQKTTKEATKVRFS